MKQFTINEKFQFLRNIVSMVAVGQTPSLVITGEGGIGKTWTVTKTIEDCLDDPNECVQFKGYSTPRGLYNLLYDNRDKLIVFDDCDSVLEDKVAVNILKSALDSYDKREITWMSKMNPNDEYPKQFEFCGRIIFISNKKRSSIDGAILSRSLVVDLEMSNSEKIERMKYIVEDILPDYDIIYKLEALDFLSGCGDGVELSLRSLIKITKVRKNFPETWVDLAQFMVSK